MTPAPLSAIAQRVTRRGFNGDGERHAGGPACQCRWCVDDRADEALDRLDAWLGASAPRFDTEPCYADGGRGAS